MKLSSIVLRAVPFILTFTAGLLIASIFVPISSPGLRGKNRFENYRNHERWSKDKCRKPRRELRELRDRNEMLESQNAELRRALEQNGVKFGDVSEFDVPPPPMTPVRNVKMRSVPVER